MRIAAAFETFRLSNSGKWEFFGPTDAPTWEIYAKAVQALRMLVRIPWASFPRTRTVGTSQLREFEEIQLERV